MEFLYEYGLFLAKAATLVVAILVAVGGIVGTAMKQKHTKGQLEISSISERIAEVTEHAQAVILDKAELKQLQKNKKKASKENKKNSKDQQQITTGRLFVIDFKGSMDAHEVDTLREEVSAVLCVAQQEDEVLVKVESGGGVVHGYGLAASQLQRIRDKGIKLTVAVDKVAASGGYMMACVADKVVAANFAIIGSIGVIAQLPNFNKLLKKNNIDFEQHTAGQFKRTLTVFGENNELGREKFREELEEVHQMFKGFVHKNRPGLNIESVATGEYWYGQKALEMGLVDHIQTSDDFIIQAAQEQQVFSVKYSLKRNMAEKLGMAAMLSIESCFMRLWSKSQSIFK